MKLQYSPGYQYAVYSADYVGYGDLDAGVKGTVKANYYFSGQTDQVSIYRPPPNPNPIQATPTRDTNKTTGFFCSSAPGPLHWPLHQARRRRPLHLVTLRQRLLVQRQLRGFPHNPD